MKCIISKSGKTIERVSEELARKKVLTGAWNYISKELWKKSIRKMPEENSISDETDTQIETKVHGLKAKERKALNKK